MHGTPVHLLTRQAQWGTQRRQQDEERQSLEDCRVQNFRRARKSPCDKPEPRRDLITTFFERTDEKTHELMLL